MLGESHAVLVETKAGVETPEHDGLFVPGGSISILYSLLLARDVVDSSIRKAGMDRTRNLVAFCSENAHYSYKKSAIVTGLGEEKLGRGEVFTERRHGPGCFAGGDCLGYLGW